MILWIVEITIANINNKVTIIFSQRDKDTM